MSVVQVTAGSIAEYLGVSVKNPDIVVSKVSSLHSASAACLTFAANAEAMQIALASKAGLILVPATARQEQAEPGEVRLLAVSNPRQAFSMVYHRWFRPATMPGIHPAAMVERGARIGEGSRIEAGAYLEEETVLGSGCWIGPRAVLLAGTHLGDRVRVQAGAILGSDGFGYVQGEQGYVGFPQIGTLEVGDDVEIGAGTTIDRGALETTVIGRGTKIDNLVHIAHNCRIGEDVLIAAQVGIAGSSVVGDRAILGGQVGIGEHAWIGPGVILGGSAGVLPHKRLEGDGQVFWGTPARPVREYLWDVARMRRGR